MAAPPTHSAAGALPSSLTKAFPPRGPDPEVCHPRSSRRISSRLEPPEHAEAVLDGPVAHAAAVDVPILPFADQEIADVPDPDRAHATRRGGRVEGGRFHVDDVGTHLDPLSDEAPRPPAGGLPRPAPHLGGGGVQLRPSPL